MKDWLDLPLKTLGENPRTVAERHDKLTGAARPPPTAACAPCAPSTSTSADAFCTSRGQKAAPSAPSTPLSRQMVRCLVRAMRAGRYMHPEQAQTWIFAADSADGHTSSAALESGQHGHHWLIPQNGWGKNVPDWIKNHPLNIKPMPDAVTHWRIHNGVGDLPRFNPAQRYWFGTPDWVKAATGSAAGHAVDAANARSDRR
jgi:hypothetical protein